MPNKNIPDLPAASALSGAELFELTQGGINKRAQLNTLLQNYFGDLFWPLAGEAEVTDDVTISGAFAVSLLPTTLSLGIAGFNIGSPTTTGTREIVVQSSAANTALRVQTKGTGSFLIGNDSFDFAALRSQITGSTAHFSIGSANMPGTMRRMNVVTSDSFCDLEIQIPGTIKLVYGSGARVQIGRSDDTGTSRIIGVESSESDVSFNVQTKGAGSFIWTDQALTEYARLTSTSRLGLGITNPTAILHLAASTTARSSLRVPDGTAPISPNGGDIWAESGTLKYYDGSTTQTLAFV